MKTMGNNGDDAMCCLMPLKMFGYGLMSMGIFEISKVSITTVYAFDVKVNDNHDFLPEEYQNLGEPEQYVGLLISAMAIYIALAVCFSTVTQKNRVSAAIGYINSMFFWVSLATVMFTMLLSKVDAIHMRCGDCEYDTLENQHLYYIQYGAYAVMCVALVGILVASFVENRDFCGICNAMWYLLFPMLMWLTVLLICFPEAAQSASNSSTGEISGPKGVELNNIQLQSNFQGTLKYDQMV